MAFKKAAAMQQNKIKNSGCRKSVVFSLIISMVFPIALMAARAGSFSSTFGHEEFLPSSTIGHPDNARKLKEVFPTQVAVSTKPVESTELNLNIVGQDLSSLLVREETVDVSRTNVGAYKEDNVVLVQKTEDEQHPGSEHPLVSSGAAIGDNSESSVVGGQPDGPQHKDNDNSEPAKESNDSRKSASPSRRTQKKGSTQDAMIRRLRDQLIMGKVYTSLAQAQNNIPLLQQLKSQTKEIQELLSDAETDSELPTSADSKSRRMAVALDDAKNQYYDCQAIVKKLRAMLYASEQEARMLKKQSVFLSQLAAKTVPKGLHCLSMRLTVEYYSLPPEKRELPRQNNLEDNSLYHYALFSDNVLAASVVVNSTISHAREPEKHVFHVVTDNLNYGAMKMWFLENPPSTATIEVQSVDNFKWLNSSYCPVLRQLESVTMKEYYFRANNPAVSTGLKYRNPKYLSMLNHLRFYLPEIYPKLDKVLFLDDDIVVQKDLTPLWSINLRGNVNGAVETCGASFHRFDKYLNFSNPHISKNFDPLACGWAYGMNIFDLQQWKAKDITGIYHKWQNMNKDRTLWKLGTLPPGLITFYNLTYPLNKHWHVLGLGYNAEVKTKDIHSAAVIHYNGNMKPWLEIGMVKYKHYWSRHVKFDHPFLVQCNINE